MLTIDCLPAHAPNSLNSAQMFFLAAFFVCGTMTIPFAPCSTLDFLEHVLACCFCGQALFRCAFSFMRLYLHKSKKDNKA